MALSMMVTVAEGYFLIKWRAVEAPNTPAPTTRNREVELDILRCFLTTSIENLITTAGVEIEWKDTSFKLGMSVNPAPTLLTCTSAPSSRRATSRIRRGRTGTKISSPTYAQEGAQGNG